MVSTFVCFQLTFVNQFWYLMFTMFCSQSKMHLRLAAVVGIDLRRSKTRINKTMMWFRFKVILYRIRLRLLPERKPSFHCSWLNPHNIYGHFLKLQLLISAQTVSFFLLSLISFLYFLFIWFPLLTKANTATTGGSPCGYKDLVKFWIMSMVRLIWLQWRLSNFLLSSNSVATGVNLIVVVQSLFKGWVQASVLSNWVSLIAGTREKKGKKFKKREM